MADYNKLAATAKRLIEANGRSVTFRRLGQQVTDPTKPWRASENVRDPAELEVPALAVFVDPVSAARMGLGIATADFIGKIESVALVAADSAPAFNLETFHEIVETNTIFKIEHVEVLRPGTKKLLYIFLLVSAGPVPSNIFLPSLLTNLLAWWRLEGEANGVWPDAQNISSRHLTPFPSPLIEAAKIGFGASFAGVHRLLQSSAALNLTGGSFEVAAWIKMNQVGLDQVIFGKQDGASLDGWDIMFIGASNSFALNLYDSNSFNSERCLSQVAILPGVLTFVQAWYDSGAGMSSIRINGGNQIDDDGLIHTATVNNFTIGSDSAGSNPFFGTIDELAIWNRVLQEDERAALYNNGYGLTYP